MERGRGGEGRRWEEWVGGQIIAGIVQLVYREREKLAEQNV